MIQAATIDVKGHTLRQNRISCSMCRRVSTSITDFDTHESSTRIGCNIMLLWLRLKVSSPFRQQFKWQLFLIRLLVSDNRPNATLHTSCLASSTISPSPQTRIGMNEFRSLLCATSHTSYIYIVYIYVYDERMRYAEEFVCVVKKCVL